jgi:hypothetical protein
MNADKATADGFFASGPGLNEKRSAFASSAFIRVHPRKSVAKNHLPKS